MDTIEHLVKIQLKLDLILVLLKKTVFLAILLAVEQQKLQTQTEDGDKELFYLWKINNKVHAKLKMIADLLLKPRPHLNYSI